jgi:tight adherence protein B
VKEGKNMQPGLLMFAALVGFAVFLGFVALWRLLGTRDTVETRLAEMGGRSAETEIDRVRPSAMRRINRLLAGFGFGARLAEQLSQADLALTAAEFSMIMAGAIFLGFALGTWRVGLLGGILLGAIAGSIGIFYLRARASRRRRAFTQQIPDILTLLVGALRAGYGLTQALGLLVDQVGPPATAEFARVMRAISLGVPVQSALGDMARRIDSADLDMVVTAITVQHETGGNLAQTLDTIAETVRGRIQLLREVQVLTAQQRMTGYVLTFMPFAVGAAIYLINPSYIMRLFEPGWIRLLPAGAIVLMIIGYLIISRIVDIEV